MYIGAVYKLFCIDTYTACTPHHVDSYVTGAVSYYVRSGDHDQNLADWTHYRDIAANIK